MYEEAGVSRKPWSAGVNAPVAHTLAAELGWLEAAIQARMEDHFQAGGEGGLAVVPEPPVLAAGDAYADGCAAARLGTGERLALALAAAPWLRPAVLDQFMTVNATYGRRFTEFGGMLDAHGAGFAPTIETALFLVSGTDLAARLAAMTMFAPGTPLAEHRLLGLQARTVAPWQALELHPEFAERLFCSG